MYLDVACNDPDNGLFAYRADTLNINGAAEFEACVHCSFRERPKGFMLSGKFWSVSRSAEWVGNWCWNRYYLNDPITFVYWLKNRGLFRCIEGQSDFCDWFNGDGQSDLSAWDIRNCLR